LRPAKVKQKVSNCFRTLAGAACYARIAGFMAPATRLHHEKEQAERLRSIDRRSKRQLHLGYLNNYTKTIRGIYIIKFIARQSRHFPEKS
jgi:hypothetical protein